MAAVSFSEAAQLLGHRSRSTLYRMRDDGRLDAYLRPGGKGGAQLLETHPEGRPSLAAWVEGVTGPQAPALPRPAADREQRRRELEQRQQWEPLPQGPPSADRLAAADGSEPFWASFGRIAPDEPLTDAQFWEHVAAITAGMLGRPLGLAPAELGDVAYFLDEARADVEAGARWDAARWDEASARALLADLPCPLSAAELAQLLAAGRIPAAMVAEVEGALAQQAAAA